MILVSKTYWKGAPFWFKKPPERARSESLVLRAADTRQFRAVYWTPEAAPNPAVAVVCMHPRVDFTHHYSFPRLVAAGIGCLGAMSRNPNNDMTTEHEDLVLDVAGAVRWLRERRGAKTVILLGNSGGGSLSALYQAQANTPAGQRIAASPGGTPSRLPFVDLPLADAMIYVAAHRGQGAVLEACIDPSVTDEADASSVDPSLDLYDPHNGFVEAPGWSRFDPEFIARYRVAQRARVQRLDDIARNHLASSRAAGDASEEKGFAERPSEERRQIMRRRAFEPVMVIYRTMANPHYVDDTLDPSPREYGSLLSERPDLMNLQAMGFARVCTPKAWLSTWSSISTHASLLDNVKKIPQPTLVVHAARDREVYPRTDFEPTFAAVAAQDKTSAVIEGARHYFEPAFDEDGPGRVDALMDLVLAWIRERFAV